MKKPTFYLRFYKNYCFKWLPNIYRSGLRWKDKYGTPRCETVPRFVFEWLRFGISGWWGDDDYWEQRLWVEEYHNGDIPKAKKTWMWKDMITNENTWNDEYLTKRCKQSLS